MLGVLTLMGLSCCMLRRLIISLIRLLSFIPPTGGATPWFWMPTTPPPPDPLWEGGGCELTQMYRQPTHNHKPPGVVQNRAALRCSEAKH